MQVSKAFWGNFRQHRLSLIDVTVISAGFWLFGLFITGEFPMKWLAISGLILGAIFMVKEIRSIQELLDQFNLRSTKGITRYFIIGVAIMFLLAILHNLILVNIVFPSNLTWFALVSALIGSTEELIFRGYIQQKAERINILFGIGFAALSHAIYKCSLFIFPVAGYDFPLIYLFLLTMGAGLFIGWITHKSRSVIPAVVAHAVFDIIVYGGLAEAPWWVF